MNYQSPTHPLYEYVHCTLWSRNNFPSFLPSFYGDKSQLWGQSLGPVHSPITCRSPTVEQSLRGFCKPQESMPVGFHSISYTVSLRPICLLTELRANAHLFTQTWSWKWRFKWKRTNENSSCKPWPSGLSRFSAAFPVYRFTRLRKLLLRPNLLNYSRPANISCCSCCSF